MTAPPLLPDARLQRALEVARVNGRGVLWLCVASAVCAPFLGDWTEAGFALVAAASGLMELHGRRRLLAADPRGRRWLVGAQAWLLVLIVGYAAWRWLYATPEQVWQLLPGFLQRHIDRELLAAGLDPALDRPLLLNLTNKLTSACLVFVGLVYQGGLAVYYLRLRETPSTPAAQRD